MSFEIYAQAFQNGEQATFSHTVVESIFAPYVEKREKGVWLLEADGSSLGELFIEDQPEIGSISIQRPSRDARLWDALLELMRRTGCVLYWPGGGPLITGQDHAAHLPPDFLRSLGLARVVTTGQQILEAIAQS